MLPAACRRLLAARGALQAGLEPGNRRLLQTTAKDGAPPPPPPLRRAAERPAQTGPEQQQEQPPPPPPCDATAEADPAGKQVRTARPGGALQRASFYANLPREWWSEAARQQFGQPPRRQQRQKQQQQQQPTWEALVLGSRTCQLLFPRRAWQEHPTWGAPRRAAPPAVPGALAQRLSDPLPAAPRARRAHLRVRLATPPRERAAARRRPRPWGLVSWLPRGAEAQGQQAGACRGSCRAAGSGRGTHGSAGSDGGGGGGGASPARLPPDDFAPLFTASPQPQWCSNAAGSSHPAPQQQGQQQGQQQDQDPPEWGALLKGPCSGGGGSGEDAFGAGAVGAAVWCDLPAGCLPRGVLLHAAAAAAEAAAPHGRGGADGWREDEDGGGEWGDGSGSDGGGWGAESDDDAGAWLSEDESSELEEEALGADGGGGGLADPCVYMTERGVVFGFWARTPLG
ncbi:hypothetical protein Rsub_01993 [Raphidocelis subcapitata]|uniref:Uncharacterized protein n=1 Tax=Raphidocelis subcapitata TaxID=307507 RepID=A0A2V0NP65_9CHLO|nr:hypothetical protein Rsub_01993 [Raphidocelis subcapitata]|eukprot:GBF89421.1 hypothetical protein Rsub_01993 [Raphidocelis subcapitata]